MGDSAASTQAAINGSNERQSPRLLAILVTVWPWHASCGTGPIRPHYRVRASCGRCAIETARSSRMFRSHGSGRKRCSGHSSLTAVPPLTSIRIASPITEDEKKVQRGHRLAVRIEIRSLPCAIVQRRDVVHKGPIPDPFEGVTVLPV